ncbi:MAG: MoaD/ThiS family protein [Cellvibrionaceae bacterium]
MIKILFFAQLREQLDCCQMEFPWSTGLTIAELRNKLIENNPAWNVFLGEQQLLSALNQTLVDDGMPLNENDEVAFFPPVTGG